MAKSNMIPYLNGGTCQGWRSRAVAISMGLLAACNGNSTGGTDMGDGGSSGDGGSNGDGGSSNPVMVTISRSGSGTGKVVSQPAGIDCGGAGSCTATFPGGTTITLTAQGSGSAFSGWTGACAGQSAACQLTPSSDVTANASFDPLVCTADFICWEAPLPFGMDLKDVTAVSSSDAWAVGTQGSILHWDGTNWKLVPSGTLQDLQGVSGSASNNVWVAGGVNGQVLQWAGSSWATVSTGSTVFNNGIYTASPNSVFVTTDSPDVVHYNGTWTIRSSNARVSAHLLGISGTSASNVWVYGDDLTICHWNGTWTASPRTLALTGIWASAVNDTFAIDSQGDIYRNQGAGFNKVGPVSATPSGIKRLWGTSPSNIFTSGPTAVLYRYDGAQWNPIQTSAKEINAYAKGAGVAANDVWAVGPRGVIAHWDGTAATSRRANVFSSDLNSAWGSGVNDVWFSTNTGTVVHYDGTSYTESAALVTGAGAKTFGFGGSGPSDIWLGASENNKPVLLHNTGSGWNRAQLPQLFSDGDTAVNLVWAASASLAWASGLSFTTPLKWNGTSWDFDSSIPISALTTAIWGSSANDVWLTGGGELYHYTTAGGWVKNTMLTAALYSLGGTGAGDVWAGGAGVVYHWNGGSWSAAMSLPVGTGNVVSISATAANDVWFTDSAGRVFRWSGGATFKLINTSLGNVGTPMHSWAANANNVWFAGRGILSYRR
jgi:hypothetical protein